MKRAIVVVMMFVLVALRAASADAPETRYYVRLQTGERSLQVRSDGTLRMARAAPVESQSWRLIPAGGGIYRISNALNGRCLALRKGLVVVVKRGTDSAQLWKVVSNGDNYFISNQALGDNLVLTVGAGAQSPVMAVNGGADPSQTQMWTLFRTRLTSARAPMAGNYLRNDGPVPGTVTDGRYGVGTLWRVVAPSIAGRAQPDPSSKVVRTFRRGTILQADIGRGGSDEVLWNATDNQGNTWMKVRTAKGVDLNCYVRANVRYIQPVRRK